MPVPWIALPRLLARWRKTAPVRYMDVALRTRLKTARLIWRMKVIRTYKPGVQFINFSA